MATSPRIVKKISAPYALVAVNGESTQFIVGAASTNNAEVTINGNLTVLGTQTSISSINTEITDNIITLNAGLPSNVAPTIDAGININRGSAANVMLRWNESVLHWQITNDGTNFSNIASQQFGNYLTAVVEDLAPTLGGNLVTTGFSISANNNVVIAPGAYAQVNAALQLKELVTPPPTNVTGFGLLYAGTPNGGGSGIYVTNGVAANQELVTKKKAIVYSLIF